MCSSLGNFSILHHQNLGKCQGGDNPVGNKKYGSVLHPLVQIMDNTGFRCGIYGTEAIVENQAFRVRNKRPGYRNPLFLSSAKGNPTLSYQGLLAKG